jgi:tetraether lipid synthase
MGINFQPAFHAGRHVAHDPMQRITIPDVIRAIESQTDGLFRPDDLVPVPCCFPTCNAVTYAYVEGPRVIPLPRVLNVEDYLDYIQNRAFVDVGKDIRRALEGLWSSSAVPGSETAAGNFAVTCAACGLPDKLDLRALADRMFMVMMQDFMDPWTFNQKNLMKCCKEFLLPDRHQIPFCAYNTVGYREQARVQLTARERARQRARRQGVSFTPAPISFEFDTNGHPPHGGRS